jgi:hypothetical protein
MDELIQEWKLDDAEVPSSVVGSPLDLLLGRVDESEDEYGSLQSMEQEKDFLSTSRSISSESLATLPPSLDFEDPSYSSHWDNISTPDSISRKSLPERREKVMNSPPKEDCALDHPLLHFGQDELDEYVTADVVEVINSLPVSTERFKSFKSNLTASLQALRQVLLQLHCTQCPPRRLSHTIPTLAQIHQRNAPQTRRRPPLSRTPKIP